MRRQIPFASSLAQPWGSWNFFKAHFSFQKKNRERTEGKEGGEKGWKKGKGGKWIGERGGTRRIYWWTKADMFSIAWTYYPIYLQWVTHQPHQWSICNTFRSSHPCFCPKCLDLERLNQLSETESADLAATSLPEPSHLSTESPRSWIPLALGCVTFLGIYQSFHLFIQ